MECPGEGEMYLCGACGKSFKRCDNLKNHMAIHTDVRPYKCTLCEKSFRARGHLNAHMFIHTGEKPYKCGVCGREFNQNSNLKKHIKLHTGYRPFPCEVCGQTFTHLCYLKDHLKCHTGERDYGCPICLKKFKTNTQLKVHMMTHSHEKPFKCVICDKFFKYYKNYIVHKIAHDNEVLCYCSECGKEFRNQARLRRHMLIHQGVQLFECFACFKEFRKVDNLKKHLVIHSGEKPYHCDTCGKDFRSRSNLKSHMILHSGSHPYSCEICGKNFKYKCNYRRHMRSHTGDSLHSCSICEAVFTSKSTLDSHSLVHINRQELPLPQESIEDVTAYGMSDDENLEHIIHNIEAVDLEDKPPLHLEEASLSVPLMNTERELIELEGKKPFECHLCDREYTTSTNLKLHMRNHTGERPFKCSICSKRFTQNSLLKVHLRSHTDERLYSCSVCSKNFKHSSHLHTHMRSHAEHGGEPQADETGIGVVNNVDSPVNVCNVCGKTFARKYILNRHMRVHSDERAYSCNHCDKKFKENSHLKAHTMLHTGERPFDCYVCGKKFIQKGDQKRHMRTHSKHPSKGRPFTCDVCGLKFSYVHNFETHKIIHAMRKNKNCEEELSIDTLNSGSDSVNEGFPPVINDKPEVQSIPTVTDDQERTDSVQNQMRAEGKEEMSVAGGFVLRTNTTGHRQEGGYHKAIGNPATVEPVLKENVIRIYSNRKSLLQRLPDELCQVVSNSDENNEPCSRGVYDSNFCRIQVDTQISRDSSREPTCNLEKQGNEVQDNLQKDSVIFPKTIKCHSYGESKSLSKDLGIYECQVCQRIYRSIYTLRRHMVLHSGLRTMMKTSVGKCPLCGKKFTRISNLKRHMIIHTGERAFSCSLCGKRFKEKGHLKSHKLLLHSNERPYQCEICGKRSALRSDHKRHVRSHRGDKPFQCVLCGLKFASKRNLETHKIIHSMKKNRSRNETIVAHTLTSSEEYQLTDGPGMLSYVESEETISMSIEGGCMSRHKTGNELNLKNKTSGSPQNPFRIQTYTGTVSRPHYKSKEIIGSEVRSNHTTQLVVRVFSTDNSKGARESPQKIKTSAMTDSVKAPEPHEFNHHNYSSSELLQDDLEPVMEVEIGKIRVQAIPYELAQERNRSIQGCKNFQCLMCSKTFSTRHNLKVHLRIHTGEQPYKCSVCSKSFTQKSNLKIHMNTHREKK